MRFSFLARFPDVQSSRPKIICVVMMANLPGLTDRMNLPRFHMAYNLCFPCLFIFTAPSQSPTQRLRRAARHQASRCRHLNFPLQTPLCKGAYELSIHPYIKNPILAFTSFRVLSAIAAARAAPSARTPLTYTRSFWSSARLARKSAK